MAKDMYQCFRDLAALLAANGYDHSAERLIDAMHGGSTSSEVLGLLGVQLQEIRQAHNEPSSALLRPLLVHCAEIVRFAWPDFKLG